MANLGLRYGQPGCAVLLHTSLCGGVTLALPGVCAAMAQGAGISEDIASQVPGTVGRRGVAGEELEIAQTAVIHSS